MSATICVGCLSHDRRLTLITEEQKHLWWLILEQTFNILDPLPLCWECLNFIIKLNQFKQKVAKASDTLSKHLLKKPTECLTNLRTSATEHTSTEHQTKSSLRRFRPQEKSTENLTKNGKALCDINSSKKSSGVFRISSRTCEKTSGVLQPTLVEGKRITSDIINKHFGKPENDSEFNEFHTGERLNPLFIKVENVDDDYPDGDDGGFSNDEAECGAEKVMIEVDIKSGVARPRTSSEGFDDSDNEPLRRKPPATVGGRAAGEAGTLEEGAGKKKRRKKGKAAGKSPAADGVVTNKKALRKLEQLNVEDGSLQIVELSWEQVEEERQRARESEAFQRLEYKCHNCIVGFNHRSKLENHMLKHEPRAGAEVCAVCAVRCRDRRALQQHRRRHRLRWRCTRCGLGWSRAAVAADHVSRLHGAPAPRHRCRLRHCGHVAGSLAALRLHSKSHCARVPCPTCGASLRDRASLRAHLLRHAGARAKEHACSRCHKTFLFRKARDLHQLTHEAPAHLYCIECDMTFKNQMSYYGHMKYNLKHIDPAKLKHACPECGKRFAKAARLREHRAAIHLHLTPEKCDHPGCGFACASRAVLRAHRRSTHGSAPRRRDHVCHACGKAYTTKSSLAGHLRSHTGARPLRCSRCPAAFAYDAALYNHTRRVHKVQPRSAAAAAPLPLLPE